MAQQTTDIEEMPRGHNSLDLDDSDSRSVPDLDGYTHVYVHFVNGLKLTISLPSTCTVAQLQHQVIAKASRYGIYTSVEHTVLSTVGRYSSVVHSEDILEDILDTTEDHKFILYPLEEVVRASKLGVCPSLTKWIQGPTPTKD
jgi:hypothetical protein